MPVDNSKFVQDLAKIGSAVVNGGPELVKFNEARNRGNLPATTNDILTDRSTLTPVEFQQKYGTDVQQLLNQADQGNVSLNNYLRGATRTGGQAVADSIRDVGTGFNRAVGGIGALGIGAVSPQLGPRVNELLNRYVDYSRENMSQYSKRNEHIEAIRTELDEEDNQTRYEQERQVDGDFAAGLRNIGRNFIDAGSRTISNPAALKGVVGQGVGSLFAAGPIGRALGAAGVSAGAAMPTAIGITEAGGAYTSTVTDIMGRSHEELLQTSDDYRQRIAAGADPEDAKRQIAHNAGVIASSIQGPMGAAIGRVAGVGDFEAAPLASRTINEMLQNAIREPIEEGLQSATGQFSQNLATRFQADPSQSLIEGIGTEAATGAIGGLGAAGVVQSPRLAAQGTAKAASAAVDATLGTIRRRAEQAKKEIEAESEVSAENLAPAVQEQAAQAPVVAEGLRTLAEEQGARGEDVDAYINRIQNASLTRPEEFQTLPESIVSQVQEYGRAVGRMPDRFESLMLMAQTAQNEEASQSDRAAAGAFIIKSIQENSALFQEVPKFLENIPHDRPEYELYKNYTDIVRMIEDEPQIQKALKWAQEQMQMPETDLEGIDFSSPQGQEIINTTVNVATVAPQAVNINTAVRILEQADSGVLALSPEQRRMIRASIALQESAEIRAVNNRVMEPGMLESQLEELRQELRASEDRSEILKLVTQQIEKVGGKKGHQLSLKDHATGINQAVSQGNMKEARARIQQLGLFARSMRNKLEAMNKAIAAGDRKRVPYRALGSNGKMLPADGFFSVFYNPGSEASDRTARAIYADAVAVAHLANEYTRQYPEMGIREVVVPPLALNQNQQAEDTNRGSSTPAPSSEPSQATTSGMDETVQEELPLPPSQPTREPSNVTPVDEVGAADSTNEPGNTSIADTAPVESTVEQTQESEPVVEPVAQVVEESVSETVTPSEPEESTEAPNEDLEALINEGESQETSIKDRFPSLVQANETNLFHEAFTLPTEDRTRLTQWENPLVGMARLLQGKASDIVAFMDGNDVSYDVGTNDRENLVSLLRIGAKAINTANQRLNKVAAKKDLKNRLAKGDTAPLRIVEHRAFNIAEETDKGFRYNPQLIESAMLAGLDWVMNAQDRTARLDAEDVAEFMNVDESTANQFVDAFNNGLSMEMAVRGLADNIRKFWGVSTNPDADQTFTRGIPEGVAKEILKSFEAQGLITLGMIDARDVNNKTYGRVLFERNEETDNLIQSLKGIHDFIGDLALVENPKEGFQVGEPITEISQTQLRNPAVENTPQQLKALENYQKTPFYLNTGMHEFVTAMGKEQFVSLMSGFPYKEGNLKKTHTEMGLNKVHWDSVKGLQRSLAASFDSADKYIKSLERYSGEGEPAVFFKYEINRLGRQQMAGLNNPQTDKYIREILMPNRARVDLSDTSSEAYENFLTAAFQGLGGKPENFSYAEIRGEMGKLILNDDATMRPLLNETKSWLQSNDRKSLPESIMNQLQEHGLSMHGQNALLSLAKYEIARDTGSDLTDFEVYGYLEADGVTNGPINALMTMTGGEFTLPWMDTVAKGGAFTGSQGKSLDVHRKEDSVDLYKASANLAQTNIRDLGSTLQKTAPQAFEQFKALQQVLIEFGVKGFEFDKDGNLVLDRGVAKNPLTITGYGSGIDGIAGNVTDELLKTFYKGLSDLAQNGDKHVSFDGTFNRLFTQAVRKNQKTGEYFLASTGVSAPSGDPLTLKLSREQYNALKSNIRMLLVEPLVGGINSVFSSHITPVTETVQTASQLQSIVWKAMQHKDVALILANKKAESKKEGSFLTSKEWDQIQKRTMKWAPFYDTGTQRYLTAGAERAELFEKVSVTLDNGEKVSVNMPKAFSRSLDGDLRTPAYMFGATLAGVKAIPTTVVGSGDGQMTLNTATSGSDLVQRSMQVFDGINLPVDKIRDYSTEINESVFKTWTSNGNPVRAAQESFKKFLESDPIQALFSDGSNLDEVQKLALEEISQTYHGRRDIEPKDIVSVETAREFLLDTYRDLMRAANQTDARRRTLAEVPFSVDQMASAKSPFVSQGNLELPENATRQQIIDAMNDRYRDHLAKIEAQFAKDKFLRDPKPAPLPSDRAKRVKTLTDFVNDRGSLDGDSGARVLNIRQLGDLGISLEEPLGRERATILEAALENLSKSNLRLVFGSRQSLDAWEQTYNAESFQPGNNDNFGKYDPVANIITISNMDPETLVHELVHAATWNKVATYYSNKKALSKEDQEAIARLEGLMNEWRAIPQDTPDMARRTVEQYLQTGDTDAAVNEFMAWVLTNQERAQEAKNIKVQNPVFRIVGEALKALRKLIFGGRTKGPKVGDDILSNVRFNTQILMKTPSPLVQMKGQALHMASYQSPSFGSNPRLSALRESIHRRITGWIAEPTEAETKAGVQAGATGRRDREATQVTRQAEELASVFAEHFTDLGNMQAFSTFTLVQAALMTDMKLDGNAMSRMEDIYSHVIENLEVRDFRQNQDPNDQGDIYQAQEKLNVLNGLYGTITDAQGRSSLMSSFLALAMTSDEFRKILASKPLPKTAKSTDKTLDNMIENVAQEGLDRLSIWMSGEGRSNQNTIEALDALTEAVFKNTEDQRTYAEQKAEGFLDGADRYLADNIQNLSDRVAEKTSEILKSNRNDVIRGAAGIANLAASFINEQRAEELALGITSWLNRREGFHATRALLNDLIGQNRENSSVFDMISKVRAEVQQTRQQFRDDLPPLLESKFKAPLQAVQKTAMFKALGKTDLASLVSHYRVQGALDLIANPQRLNREIQKLEKGYGKPFQDKAKQLANYMLTGEHGPMLLPNAYAIAALATPNVKNLKATKKMVDDIDRLVSLYALQGLDQGTRDTMQDLIQNEKDGLAFMTNYLVGQRVDEQAKVGNNPVARLNHYKGYIPSENQQGGSLRIASEKDHAKMVMQGYRRIGSYNGSSADRMLGKRAYYFAPVSGRAAFNQGIMQTVHTTASGIDPETGYTAGEVTAGYITDPRMVRTIERQIRNQTQTSENLRPVFDEKGRTVAFERMADPKMLTKLNRSTDLPKMIGVWRGRQVEELLAQESNKALVDNLYPVYEQGMKEKRGNEFVNLLALEPGKDDPVLVEAASLIPFQTKEYAQEVFGPGEFWVRRDMLLDAIGERQASVGDVFTGQTRWNPVVAKELQELALGIFGRDAYKYLVAGERNIQEVVGAIKTNIVVKSVIVPAANIISNMAQLLNRGVPLRHIVRGTAKKTAEINTYIKRRKMEIDLEAELRAAEGDKDIVRARQLQTQIQSIQDSYRRMSIWPLIEAGEFSAVSNGQVTAEDLSLADGKWTAWLEQKVKGLPGHLRTPARYALITRDTALYKGLARSVQYGDFVAKAVLYDDLTQRKKMSSADAVRQVREAFVNYNRLAGRSRQFLESIGLIWFWNFKLRIMKEAAHTMRHNPLRALMTATMLPPVPGLGDVGLPTTDNFAAVLMDGRLGYSIGPEMAWNGLSLNPWINIAR